MCSKQVLSNRIQAFFDSQGISNYGAQYTLDGKQPDNRHAKGLVAVNAVTSRAATGENRNNFIVAQWNTPIPQALVERYYDGLLYMMSLLHCSGNFKIYPPK